MQRRRLLLAAGALPMTLPLAAHTPYRQWVVYRKQHLLLGCHRQDAAAYPRAKTIEAVLAEHLPEARAPDTTRLASLFVTGQLEFGLLRPDEAADMRAARGRLEAYGPVPLQAVTAVDVHAIYAMPTVRADHVWLLLDALAAAAAQLAMAAPGGRETAVHAEAARWFAHQR